MDRSNKIGPSESEAASPTSSPPRPRKQSWQDEPKRTKSLESLQDFGEPLKFDPDFSGPIKKRGCTGMATNYRYFKCVLFHTCGDVFKQCFLMHL